MIRLFILLIFNIYIYAHSGLHMKEEANETISYGIYGDFEYRDKDLFPRGIEGSAGYENHGSTKDFQINHIGAFVNGRYIDNFVYSIEFNRHVGVENTFDSYLEKAYIGYDQNDFRLILGRNYNNISFVSEKAWGYGFAKMPLAIDSFFDGTYISDGIFLDYSFMGFTSYIDITKDKYTQTLRKTFKLSYDINNIKLISYIQTRETSKIMVDYASSEHSHSHGSTDKCTNLDTTQRCFERENKVFGIGIDTKLDIIDIQSEYIYLDTKGYISNNNYKIESDNQIQTFYIQALSNYKDIIFGLRSEWFSFSNDYQGGGALEVTEPMVTSEANSIQNLQTILTGYKFNRYNRLIIQAEHSKGNWAGRLNYSLNFSSAY